MGFDRNFVVQTPYPRCEIGIGFDVDRGDVRRFLVQLQAADSCLDPAEQQLARIDHNPRSVLGHDIQSEGIHVDVVLPRGIKTTLYPEGGEMVHEDFGAVIDLAIGYLRSHCEYFVRIHRGEIAPEDPPRWP